MSDPQKTCLPAATPDTYRERTRNHVDTILNMHANGSSGMQRRILEEIKIMWTIMSITQYRAKKLV